MIHVIGVSADVLGKSVHLRSDVVLHTSHQARLWPACEYRFDPSWRLNPNILRACGCQGRVRRCESAPLANRSTILSLSSASVHLCPADQNDTLLPCEVPPDGVQEEIESQAASKSRCPTGSQARSDSHQHASLKWSYTSLPAQACGLHEVHPAVVECNSSAGCVTKGHIEFPKAS